MSAYTSDCPPLDACGPCGTLPPGFVRLRYFFGKRMGVADFVDEQRYHTGKILFHQQRLHGAGLLVGLGVTRQPGTGVVLRVGKGAAVDACGRDIVVGYDQCIDLDAWYQRAASERRATDPTWPAAALDPSGRLPLVVAIRYHECASGPEPAPRDTCSCDAAGCDFGRVREEFEIDLFAPDAPELLGATPLTPTRDVLEQVLAGALSGPTLARALAGAAQGPAPDPEPDRWLVLAGLAAAFDPAPTDSDPGHVSDVADLTGRATLLAETALLQELLMRQIGAQLEAGALVAGGPELTALTLAQDGTTSSYWLDLALSGPVVPDTVQASAFSLSRLDAGGSPAWTAAPGGSVTAAFVPAGGGAPDTIRFVIDNSGDFLADGGLYRLAMDPAAAAATPIVDQQMRPLLPLRPALSFGVAAASGGGLELAPPPYAR